MLSFSDGKHSYNYTYDANGNMKTDGRKNTTIEYNNPFNKPGSIQFDGSGNSIHFLYDGLGNKLAKIRDDGNTENYTDYIGNIVYRDRNATPAYMLTSEGRVTSVNGSYQYEYYLKDHLGNTRVRFKSNNWTAEVLQTASYYPFGKTYAHTQSEGDNKYLYNGKELQDDFGLDWYDYEVRFYDPALARFHSIDPKAEEFSHQSPFVYADNNPIRFIDFMGMNADDFYFDQDDNLVNYVENDKPDRVFVVKGNTESEDGSMPEPVVEQVEMSDEEVEQKMDKNGYKKVTKEESVIETTTEYQWTDAEGGLRTVSSSKVTNKVLSSDTKYTKKSNEVINTKRKYLRTYDRDDVAPVVSRKENVKYTYTYGNKKKNGNGAINPILNAVKFLMDEYYDSKTRKK